MAETTDQFADAMQEEAQKNAQRFANWLDAFVVNPEDPPLGATPRSEVWKRGKTRLFRYQRQKETTYREPVLIVPWLGISRTYILDLLPGSSMIEFLVKQGHDVYLLDWGAIAEEDKNLGFQEAVLRIIPRAIEQVLETSGVAELNLCGICLGGTMTTVYLALNHEAPVRNYVAIVAPIDFDYGGLFKTWLDQRHFPIDLVLERYGGIPSNLMATGFKLLRPTTDIGSLSSLWFNMDKREYITMYKAMNRWANDFIAMPGCFTQELVKELYFTNKLVKGEFAVNGRKIEIDRLKLPLLVVAAAQDHIVPPLSAKRLMDLVSSTDKEYVELPGGHISVFAGRQASKNLWPKIDEWLAQRSAQQIPG